ncbi:MAG: serine/threonine protein kinase, partial [Verrucomicrobiae bacterium]|nr:serine/threonine protein kinase [Verrucomicrobiae bacterium]
MLDFPPNDVTERRLFLGALDFADPLERLGYVELNCDGDVRLSDRIVRLLEKAGSEESALPEPIDLSLLRARYGFGEEVGDRIGHYRLIEKLGEGSFGDVWRASQERPVRREVALKILKLGMDTREVLARFDQERQALALMDHPNIAKIYDAGTTPSGRPFFVMELIKSGRTIREFCEEKALEVESRIRLVQTVCRTVQHAHRQGVIHRDLKPSNILVSGHDDGEIKVIDFGIAKASAGTVLTDLTIQTIAERPMGTPAYMSPEQFAGAGDVDTRSDVFSLGVVLYELLTGVNPFLDDSAKNATSDFPRRGSSHRLAKKPSSRAKTSGGIRDDQFASRLKG